MVSSYTIFRKLLFQADLVDNKLKISGKTGKFELPVKTEN